MQIQQRPSVSFPRRHRQARTDQQQTADGLRRDRFAEDQPGEQHGHDETSLVDEGDSRNLPVVQGFVVEDPGRGRGTCGEPSHHKLRLVTSDSSDRETANAAKTRISRKTNTVRMVSPSSLEMPCKPCFAMTLVKPAKNIDRKAKITQRCISRFLERR